MSRRRQTERDQPTWPHLHDHTDLPTSDMAAPIDGQACIMGCKQDEAHLPSCPCNDQCPNHPGHCPGCTPRSAHDRSLLCGRCFYRRLRSPLRQMPVIDAWLNTHMGGIRSASLEPGVTGSTDAAIPIRADIHDHLATSRMLLIGWARRVVDEHPKQRAVDGTWSLIGGPTSLDVATTSRYLDRHATWISAQPWTRTLIGHLWELTRRATGLAPWQQSRTMLQLPCPKCEQMTLALFGGDDWVACIAAGCDEIIGWYRYERLSKAIIRLRNQHNVG